MLRKKRNSDDSVLLYDNVTTLIRIENKVFRLKSESQMVGANEFVGVRFNNCSDVKIRNCVFIGYTHSLRAQLRAIGFLSGGGDIDIQYCTFVDCAYAVMFNSGLWNSFIFKHNIALEPKNIANTSMRGDARFVFWSGADFTTPAEVDKNRWQSIAGDGGDIFNTFASENIKLRENRLLGTPTTRTNDLSNGGGTFVTGDAGGDSPTAPGSSFIEIQKNVVVDSSPFGAQVVGEGIGTDINFSYNKILIDLKNSEFGRSEMGIQMQNCYPNFVFQGNRVRGFKNTGEEQSIYSGNFYDTCALYDEATLKSQNKDDDPWLTKERILPNRIV